LNSLIRNAERADLDINEFLRIFRMAYPERSEKFTISHEKFQKKFQGVGLASGSAAFPCVGLVVALGVAVTSSWVLTSELVTPIACVGVAIVPNILTIGRLLRNLLGVQRFAAIPSQ